MATNSIPSAVATVSAVKGTVYVRDASGTPHRLQAGDVVTAGDVVITAADGHVEFSFDNGAVLALDEGIHKIGTPAGSDSTERPDGTDAAAVDKIIQAIEQGQPIDDLLEETAAGLGAGGTDEGHGFVRLGRITEGVTSVAYQEPLASAPAPLSELAQPSVMLAPEPPQAPVAVDDLIGGLEDQALTITAAQLFGADGTGPDNDRDGDSAAFASITVVSLPAHGVMQLDGQPVAAGQTIAVADIEAGRLTFVPDPDWHGSTSFDYAVSDGAQTSNTATVTLAIASVNDAPVAVDNTVTVPEDTVMHGNVITDDDNGSAPGGVDYDVDGDPLSVTGFTVAGDPTIHNPGDTVTIAGIGTFQLNADGSYTFAPAPDYDGPVPVITYTINDGQGGQDSATLTINMAGGDDTPVAGDDHAVTNEDTPITIPVLANDSDVDGDPISIVKINGSAVQVGAPVAVDHGTVTLNADGTLTFSPAPDYYGDTSFNYTITDGITEVPATVYVTVNPVNDPPVANDDVASTPINTGIDIDVKANDSDPDNSRDDLTVSSAVLSDPSQGTLTINPDGSLHFVPAQNFSGEVEITYTLTDPEGLSDSATVTVNVGANTLPEGTDITRSTPEDTAYVVQKADFGFSDPDAGQQFHAVRIDSLPSDGKLMLDGQPVAPGQLVSVADIDAGKLAYVPDTNEHGSPYGHFTFSVQDSAGAFDNDANTFTLDVTPVNDAPDAVANHYVTAEDTATSGNLITDDDNGPAPGGIDSDIDGDSLRLTQINGQDLAFDPVSGEATVNLEHGVLTVKADGSFSFVPAADYKGTQDFTYTVADPDGLADSAAVNITVDSVNDPPIANPDPIVINEDVTSTFDPRANDFDVDTPHDQLVITSLNGQAVDPAHPENYVPTDVYDPSGRLAGQVSMTADGQVKFDPAPDYTNDPTNLPVIPYTISDGQGGQASSVITMQVRPLNDSPIAVDDLANIDEDGMPVAGNVLANDSDVDGDDLDVVGFVAGNADDGDLETPDSDGSIAGTYGTLTWNAETGEYQYTLDNSNKTVQKLGPGQTLTDTFTYEVTDGKGAVDTATLTVTVHGTDDGITITGIGAAGGDLTVHENDLPAGSSPDAGSLSKSGSFSIEALDGIKTVEVGGTTLTAAQLTAASTYPVSIETEHGTLTLTGYSGDDQGGTVSYTYTLKRTVDNDSQQGADDNHYVEQVAVTVTDSDDDAVASSINVDITDDTPSATDHAASGSAQADTNLMFIIDVAPKDDQYQGQLPDGPGMEDTGQFAGNPEWTRLHATVVAMHELIDKYDGQGDVRVYIVVFDSKGERVGGAWMTAAEAHAFADALETYIGSDGHPGGNYDAALAAAMEAYANPGDGKLADAQNVTYFMSDGVARAGDGDTATLTNQYAMATDQYEIHPDYGQSDFGIQPAEQAAWEQFLRDNNIKAYAVGMGGDVQPGELDPIAYDGQSGTDTNAIIVDEHADFQTKLVSGSDFSHHGNLLDGGGYGADGGYVRSISYGGDTFTFDGSQVTRTGNGTTTYAYDAATHQLILTTANQGVLTVDMLSGEYDYVQHGQPGLQDETFTYTLVDSDGDTTAGHTLGFTFAPAGADTPAPADDRVIVAHVVTGVDDPYVNNYLVLRDEWLLWNDSDPQGDPLAIAGVGGVTNHYTEYYTPTVAHDAADNVVNYTWQYDQGFDNHFYYSASDGENDATARVGLEYGDDVVLSTYVFDPEAPYVKTTADDDSTIIIGYDNPDHPGLKNIIHAQGGNDVVVGGAGNDSLFGDAGNDWLVGGAGNDTLYGGTGNDLLEGGSGADTFAWTLADRGNFGAPALDAIRDFNTAEGDRLDLRDLLEGEHGDASDIGNLEEYIDIATDGSGNTVIRISSSGGFDNGNYAAGAEDQRITLSNVDLYSQYGVTAGHESELIAAMMAQKNLLVD